MRKLEKTLQLKLWQNSKTQIVTKVENSNSGEKKTQKLQLLQNSKIQIVTNLKCSICEKIKIVTKLKNSSCVKTKIKWQQNSKTQIVIKPDNSNCDQTQKLKGKPYQRRSQIWERRQYQSWHTHFWIYSLHNPPYLL